MLKRNGRLAASSIVIFFATFAAHAQEAPEPVPPPKEAAPTPVRITLQEAKQRAISSNKLLNLASLNAESKSFAVKAIQADYFPKVSATSVFLHFNDDLGTVLTGGGRTLNGPRGRPLLTFPTLAADVAVLNQNSAFTNVGVVQPITDVFKIKQGVKIARADEQIALAQLEKGTREVASGTEQLYWGLLAARRLRTGAAEGVAGAEMMAATQLVEAKLALVEAKQALQEVDRQIADLQEQLNGLLDLPLCTSLELVEPDLPVVPFHCVDEAIGQALASSPDVAEVEHLIAKAQAAVAAGKLDYMPSIGIVGGYFNQTGMDYVQQNIGYVGVAGSFTLVDWGKRRNVIRERQDLVAMANCKLEQTQNEVRQKAQKLYREMAEEQEALKTAQELAVLRKEAQKKATTPKDLIEAAKKSMEADVNVVKAELNYRETYVKLMSMMSKQQ